MNAKFSVQLNIYLQPLIEILGLILVIKKNIVGNLFNSMPVRSPDGSTVSVFQLYIIKRNSQGLNGKTSKLSHIIIVNLSAIYPLIEV